MDVGQAPDDHGPPQSDTGPLTVYWAHSDPTGRTQEDPKFTGHRLREHLEEVGQLAATFAERIGLGSHANAAGLLHDLGKYGDLFQRRLEGKEHGLDHWSTGAYTAFRLGLKEVAVAIQGHHVGMLSMTRAAMDDLAPVRLTQNHPQDLRLTDDNITRLLQRYHADGLPPVTGMHRLPTDCFSSTPAGALLDVRMLFSCLVDADFLSTESHFMRAEDGAKRLRSSGPLLNPTLALGLVLSYVESLARRSQASPEVDAVRHDLLRAALATATRKPGVFTLGAPTGSGKTIAMLAFGLQHALTHSLERVIIVAPYLSILEQTGAVCRAIFDAQLGAEYVVESHSLATAEESRGSEDGYGRPRAKLLAENWDAPLIITTNVQFLESLFANRPGACRKVHRMARSVVLFDEVQTMPLALAVPTLATLEHLASRFGSTVVFSTATQPAFRHLDSSVRKLNGVGWAPREIVPANLHLFERTRRVRLQWCDPGIRTPWEAVAADIAGFEQVLCIVNLKRHAISLLENPRLTGLEGVLHLSTNMCPAHRSVVLSEIRDRLANNRPCRLVSTQCVEAGVDLDFPVVMRALGPLDAIAQAAGRCNRNGRLAEPGLVRVFRPERMADGREYPDPHYEHAATVTAEILATRGPSGTSIDDPQLFRAYYRRLYDLTRPNDGTRRGSELSAAIEAQHFGEIARCYRVIPQQGVNVIVPYRPGVWEELGKQANEHERPTGYWLRLARQHAVSVFRPQPGERDYADRVAVLEPLFAHDIGSAEWCRCLDVASYDERLGLVQQTQSWIA